MGGAVSAGHSNEELIDNLVDADYIKSRSVERVFRSVDRAQYYLPDHRDNAYKDLAWKHGHIHMSAPCIYAEVMESLQVERGQRFLNLGSGTGYLSTLVGLMLGPYGVNHGVEYHEDVVLYARGRLDHFRRTADAFDQYEFCEPEFVCGNCLLVTGDAAYDRVYCGASCPPEHDGFMRSLLRVGGILVMPLDDHLLQIRRTGETTWETKSVLPVSFASLITQGLETQDGFEMPEPEIMSLQDVCRLSVRAILRDNIRAENPGVDRVQRAPKRPRHSRGEKRRRPRRINLVPVNMGMMLMGGADDSDDEEEAAVSQSEDSSRDSISLPTSAEDPGAEYILNQMRAMQRHFIDMTRNERLNRVQEQETGEEEDEEEEDEDQGIGLEEEPVGGPRKRFRTKKTAAARNGIQSSTSSSSGHSADTDDFTLSDFFQEDPQPPQTAAARLSTSSGDDTVDTDARTRSVSMAIPICPQTTERRRFSSTTSMSTSVTSGFGTCSSVEEPVDMDAVMHHELATHMEESSSPGPSNQSQTSLVSNTLCMPPPSQPNGSRRQPTNGHQQAASSGPASDQPMAAISDTVKSSVTSDDTASVSSVDIAPSVDCDDGPADTFSGLCPSFCKQPPEVSVDSPAASDDLLDDMLQDSDDDDDDDDDPDDVDMERAELTSEPAEDEDASSSEAPGAIYRRGMRQKVEQLPIPPALKQFLLFYRA